MKILIQKVHIISPQDNINDVLDILIENNKIKCIKKEIPQENSFKLIDGKSKILSPHFIEIPCFAFRKNEKKNISQVKSAIAGGFLHLIPSYSYVNFFEKQIQKFPFLKIDFFLNSKNFYKLNYESIEQKKYISIVEHEDYNHENDIFKKLDIFNYAQKYNKILFLNSKNALSKEAYVYEGNIAFQKGFYPLSPLAEILPISKNIEIAKQLKTPIHIYEVNQNQSIFNIKKAKQENIDISSSIPSYYFNFFEEDLLCNNNIQNFKVYPPLISEKQKKYLIESIKNNTIDFIRSGDEPCFDDEKNLPFENAKKGMINFETHFSILYEQFIKKNILSLNQLIKKLVINPYKILKLPIPSLKEGGIANFILFDPHFPMNNNKMISQFNNTPFKNKTWNGAIVYAIANGKIVFNRYLNKFY